ncbi:hypothetical protein E2C01_049970 [Portunus trituberculatus]|uniref:Uncharacterized protein n=1 Tax=Portunus trituberculatus TaxID=210409 RepID=A0A5B7G708_PORTR|nr:hypothetical protein [Portunus trituberculatus]
MYHHSAKREHSPTYSSVYTLRGLVGNGGDEAEGITINTTTTTITTATKIRPLLMVQSGRWRRTILPLRSLAPTHCSPKPCLRHHVTLTSSHKERVEAVDDECKKRSTPLHIVREEGESSTEVRWNSVSQARVKVRSLTLVHRHQGSPKFSHLMLSLDTHLSAPGQCPPQTSREDIGTLSATLSSLLTLAALCKPLEDYIPAATSHNTRSLLYDSTARLESARKTDCAC